MAPHDRSKHNRPLPRGWRWRYNAYYWRVPPTMRPSLGKTEYRLGSTLAEAYQTWAKLMEDHGEIQTVGDLLDRYDREVIPTKSRRTADENRRYLTKLRQVFGEMPLADKDRHAVLEPHHVYTYLDKRGARTAGLREIEVLRHALTKATEWGLIRRNPLAGQLNLRGRRSQGRSRYVEDWEIIEALSLPSRHHRGSVRAIQAYIRIKLLTALRMTDLLSLRTEDLAEDGIHVQPSKTRGTTGQSIIIEWTPELREAVDMALAARPVDISPWIFCTRKGAPYIREDGRQPHGWGAMWRRFVDRVLAETEVTERFSERDLRAKAASDADSLAHAQALLAHADGRTTQRWYRRKPTRVQPIHGPKGGDGSNG